MIYSDAQALSRAKYYLQQVDQPWTADLSLHNFKQFYDTVVDAIADMSPRQREAVPYAWAQRFAALGGDWDKRVKRDPTLLYSPRTLKHQAFHDSNAFVRYLISANGIGKTLMCYMELIWRSTGQRHYNGTAANSIVVSTGHAGYSTDVFTRKMVEGEDQDPYSPYVPEDGYWFHSFDRRNYILRLACFNCAEAGKPKNCTHTKSIKCLSADSGKERLMGFTASLGLIDEHIPEDVWNEIIQRVVRVQGRMMVAATPLAGPDAWEVRNLYDLWKKRKEENWRSPSDHSQGRYVDVFQISKYDCIGSFNGPTEESIAMEKATMPASEFRVRVMGEPMPLGDSIFDLNVLDNMEVEHCRPAEYGSLDVAPGQTIETLEYAEDLLLTKADHTTEESFEGNYFWEHPQKDCHYVIGADVASGAGVTRRDASVGYVLKLFPDLRLEMVAAHFSYLDVYDYAREIKKLAIYYNQALVVPEVNPGSIGSAFLAALYKELSYPSVFIGETPAEQIAAGPDSRIGVTTTATTKPAMIMSLLHYVHRNHLIIKDKEAISECRTFQKQRTESGLNYRYAAASGAHDDRVMALAMVAFACKVHWDQVSAFAISPTTRTKEPRDISKPGKRKKFNF